MGRTIVAWAIAVAAIVAVAGAGRQIFSATQAVRRSEVQSISRSPSSIRLTLRLDYERGPVQEESYAMVDDNGRSDASYAVTDRHGTTARFHETIAGYGVSFLFDRLVSDGIWEVTDRPPRGDTTIRYTVAVDQTVQDQHGMRTITFTDPHYWATTAGRQYQIHLDKGKPVPDLLTLGSTSVADPRYERIVGDFRSFGSAKFKATIRTARERLGLPA